MVLIFYFLKIKVKDWTNERQGEGETRQQSSVDHVHGARSSSSALVAHGGDASAWSWWDGPMAPGHGFRAAAAVTLHPNPKPK